MSVLTQQETLIGEREELRSELHSLRSGCVAYRLDRTLVSLSGKDRTRWLNGMVSNNIRDLRSGHGVYAFVLNPQGKIQGDLYAFHRGETIVVELDRAQIPGCLAGLQRRLDRARILAAGIEQHAIAAAHDGIDGHFVARIHRLTKGQADAREPGTRQQCGTSQTHGTGPDFDRYLP